MPSASARLEHIVEQRRQQQQGCRAGPQGGVEGGKQHRDQLCAIGSGFRASADPFQLAAGGGRFTPAATLLSSPANKPAQRQQREENTMKRIAASAAAMVIGLVALQ